MSTLSRRTSPLWPSTFIPTLHTHSLPFSSLRPPTTLSTPQLTHTHTPSQATFPPNSPFPLWHSWGRTAPLKKIWGRPKREAQQQSLCAAAEHTCIYTPARTHICTHQWCQTGFIRVREGGREAEEGEGGWRGHCSAWRPERAQRECVSVCVSSVCVSSSDLSSLPSVNHRLWHSL